MAVSISCTARVVPYKEVVLRICLPTEPGNRVKGSLPLGHWPQARNVVRGDSSLWYWFLLDAQLGSCWAPNWLK